MSKAERLLSYSLLSMITAKPLASAPTTGIREEEEDEEEQNKAHRGHVNEQGAWCWREGCESLSCSVAPVLAIVDPRSYDSLPQTDEGDAEDRRHIADCRRSVR